MMYTGRRTGVASPVGHRRYTHVRDVRETSHRRSRAELDGGGPVETSSDPHSLVHGGREPGKLTPRGGRWETLVLKLAESLRSRLATPHETQSTCGRPANPWNTGAKSRADPPRRFPGLTPLYIRYAQALDASTTLRTHAHRDRDHSGRGASQRQESSPHTAVRATDCLPNTKELSHQRLDWIPREESRFQAEDGTSNRVRIGRELREPEQFP